MSGKCIHEAFHVRANVNYMADQKRYVLEVKLVCTDCNTPFVFLGLPEGLDLSGVAVSPDKQELRVAVAPLGEEVPPIDGVSGFEIKRKV